MICSDLGSLQINNKCIEDEQKYRQGGRDRGREGGREKREEGGGRGKKHVSVHCSVKMIMLLFYVITFSSTNQII